MSCELSRLTEERLISSSSGAQGSIVGLTEVESKSMMQPLLQHSLITRIIDSTYLVSKEQRNARPRPPGTCANHKDPTASTPRKGVQLHQRPETSGVNAYQRPEKDPTTSTPGINVQKRVTSTRINSRWYTDLHLMSSDVIVRRGAREFRRTRFAELARWD